MHAPDTDSMSATSAELGVEAAVLWLDVLTRLYRIQAVCTLGLPQQQLRAQGARAPDTLRKQIQSEYERALQMAWGYGVRVSTHATVEAVAKLPLLHDLSGELTALAKAYINLIQSHHAPIETRQLAWLAGRARVHSQQAMLLSA